MNGHPFIVHGEAGRNQPQRADPRTAMELEDILDIGIQVSDALGASHAKGIIHRVSSPPTSS